MRNRELRLAVVLCLAGSALLLLALARTWVTVTDGQSLTIDAQTSGVPGSDVVPAAQALAVVGLAGVVALAATRRLGRVLVGLLVLAAGLVSAVAVVRALAEGLPEQAGLVGATEAAEGHPLWAVVSVLASLLLASGGAVVTARGRRWAALSSAYEPPAAQVEPPVTDKGVWDALDRGDDPTA